MLKSACYLSYSDIEKKDFKNSLQSDFTLMYIVMLSKILIYQRNKDEW